MTAAPSDPIVGIDLGTTNSLVAVANWPSGVAGAPRIIPDAQGRAMLPSVVRFDDRGVPIELGYEAKAHAVAHPLSTISSVKRLMGRSIADAKGDVPYLSFKVVEGAQNTARIELPLGGEDQNTGGTPVPRTKVVSPQEVSAIILRRLKEQASAALGVEVRRAVVTVPAYFDDAQRQATRDAGRLAGLEVVRIVNEPTAAALAYGLGLRESAGVERQSRIVVVYDLGGGTFDVSVLKITPGEGVGASVSQVSDFFQVLATSGDTHLGGDDFDQALVGLFTREINERFGSMSFPPETVQALRQLAEGVKIKLSDEESARVRIDLRGAGVLPGKAAKAHGQDAHATEYERTITRAELETLAGPLVERTIDACRRALRDARRGMGDLPVQAVVLVGGATRTPLVRRRVEEFFGLAPYTALNPDEVVALGAAVQAGVLAGGATPGAKAGLLLDVVPLSLGIETVGGAMAKLVVRNTTVPARASEMFSTSVDNQTGIKLHVLQGEREMAADCRSLGRFELRGIPPMPAGIPKLRVEFAVDASGILTVRATEERSGKRLERQIVPNHGLTQEEVERMEQESFTHAREDMTRHRIVDLIANCTLDLGWISKQMERLGGELPGELRTDLQGRIDSLRSMVERARADWKSGDADAMHAAKEELDRASVRLHEIAIAKSLREDA
jgi:molecular chaperone DnaK (HSP70)